MEILESITILDLLTEGPETLQTESDKSRLGFWQVTWLDHCYNYFDCYEGKSGQGPRLRSKRKKQGICQP
jgi:hypothetical protein